MDMVEQLKDFLNEHEDELDKKVYDALIGFCDEAEDDENKAACVEAFINKLTVDGNTELTVKALPDDPLYMLDFYDEFMENR